MFSSAMLLGYLVEQYFAAFGCGSVLFSQSFVKYVPIGDRREVHPFLTAPGKSFHM